MKEYKTEYKFQFKTRDKLLEFAKRLEEFPKIHASMSHFGKGEYYWIVKNSVTSEQLESIKKIEEEICNS